MWTAFTQSILNHTVFTIFWPNFSFIMCCVLGRGGEEGGEFGFSWKWLSFLNSWGGGGSPLSPPSARSWPEIWYHFSITVSEKPSIFSLIWIFNYSWKYNPPVVSGLGVGARMGEFAPPPSPPFFWQKATFHPKAPKIPTFGLPFRKIFLWGMPLDSPSLACPSPPSCLKWNWCHSFA